jgi:hypothetical protein
LLFNFYLTFLPYIFTYRVSTKSSRMFSKLREVKVENKEQNDRNGVFATKREITVKKRGFFGALLSSAIKGSLCASSLVFNCVFGDVAIDPTTAPNAAPGAVGIRINNFWPGVPEVPDGAPAESFADYATAHAGGLPANVAFNQNAREMLGYAYFVHADGSASPVYVCKKRPAKRDVPSNNPAVGGSVFNFGCDIHTERQLAIIALGNALGAGVALPAPARKASRRVINAINGKLQTALTQAGAAAGLGGTLHIYTRGKPCSTQVDDNARFTCLEYYMELAQSFPLVDFHIYFPQDQVALNPQFISRAITLTALEVLIDGLRKVAQASEKSKREEASAEEVAKQLRMDGKFLRRRGEQGDWRTIAIWQDGGGWGVPTWRYSKGSRSMVPAEQRLDQTNDKQYRMVIDFATNGFNKIAEHHPRDLLIDEFSKIYKPIMVELAIDNRAPQGSTIRQIAAASQVVDAARKPNGGGLQGLPAKLRAARVAGPLADAAYRVADAVTRISFHTI